MSKAKKKSGGKAGIIIVIILLIAAILAILYFFGGSFGLGSGDGGAIPAIGTVSEDSTEPESETEPEETNAEIISGTDYSVINVTILEDSYTYLNDDGQIEEITIDELIEKINGAEDKCEVHITISETATLNAVEDLTAELDKHEDKAIYLINDLSE